MSLIWGVSGKSDTPTRIDMTAPFPGFVQVLQYKSSGVKLVLWDQISVLSAMMLSC